jgi:hypothetical protein
MKQLKVIVKDSDASFVLNIAHEQEQKKRKERGEKEIFIATLTRISPLLFP